MSGRNAGTAPAHGPRSNGSERRCGSRTAYVVIACVLAASSFAGLLLTDNVRWLKVAVLVAVWGCGFALLATARLRRDDDFSDGREADLRRTYELELDREVAARREYELQLEVQLRRELEHTLRDDLGGLRQELGSLRRELAEARNGELLFERVALQAEATRLTSSDRSRLGSTRLGIELPSEPRSQPALAPSPAAVAAPPVSSDQLEFGTASHPIPERSAAIFGATWPVQRTPEQSGPQQPGPPPSQVPPRQVQPSRAQASPQQPGPPSPSRPAAPSSQPSQPARAADPLFGPLPPTPARPPVAVPPAPPAERVPPAAPTPPWSSGRIAEPVPEPVGSGGRRRAPAESAVPAPAEAPRRGRHYRGEEEPAAPERRRRRHREEGEDNEVLSRIRGS